MTREIRSTRPARAAIAAVLAFSAPPLLAQEVAPSPVAPVAEPAAPQVAPVMDAAPSAPPASAPVMAPAQPVVQSTPSVEDRKAEAIAQAETARAEAAPAPVQRVQKRPAVRTAAAPTPAPAETVAAAPVRAVAPAPVEAIPVEPTPVAPEMAASTPAEPAAVTPPVINDLAQADNSNEALTWGLAGGALLLVGAAGTMAMRRRRNRAGDSAYRVDEGVTLHTSEGIVTVPETALARAPVEPTFRPMAPVAMATRTPLAADRPHSSVAAMADAPPSPANPFLTRSNRLRRAHFLLAQQADGTERTGTKAATVAPQATPVDRSQTVYRFGKDDARLSSLVPRTR